MDLPEAGLEESGESLGGGAVDGQDVVLLGHGTLVVGDHEVVTGHGDGEPGEEGGDEPLAGQVWVVRGLEVQLGGGGEVQQYVTGKLLLRLVLPCDELALVNLGRVGSVNYSIISQIKAKIATINLISNLNGRPIPHSSPLIGAHYI